MTFDIFLIDSGLDPRTTFIELEFNYLPGFDFLEFHSLESSTNANLVRIRTQNVFLWSVFWRETLLGKMTDSDLGSNVTFVDHRSPDHSCVESFEFHSLHSSG